MADTGIQGSHDVLSAAVGPSGPNLTAARIGCGASSVILRDRPESETIKPPAKGENRQHAPAAT